MIHTARATRGMVVAPHGLAAESGVAVLREGGNAIEAAVATAATLSVVYSHMTGIGGDSFWLLRDADGAVSGIDACGRSGEALTPGWYEERGLTAVPARGPAVVNTVAGAVSGWARALEVARAWGGGLPAERLLADAVHYAQHGYPVTEAQATATAAHRGELATQPGFAATFLANESMPAVGSLQRQPRLARTLGRLAEEGFDTLYRGSVAEALAEDLEGVGSPLGETDLAGHRAEWVTPLSLRFQGATVYNLPPPTQGVASLMILGLFERWRGGMPAVDSADYIHLLVEATKQAFKQRDRTVCDPGDMADGAVAGLLDDAHLQALADGIDADQAAAWQGPGDIGDTTWFGAIDGQGRAVSAIQSLYQAFGSGVVLPRTGICWQNRGSAFSLDPASTQVLRPGRKPFHTLNPAAVAFPDGRFMVYGAMGGEGQPQTQAAVFTRYAVYGQGLQAAVTTPRWLLGRAWGEPSTGLRLENRFDAGVADALRRRGHAVTMVGPFESIMGHAGALVHHPQGVIEGAGDPRSDGGPVGW